MFRLIRFLISLVVLAALAYAAVTVPLGSRTLWEHAKAIADTEESKQLVEGVRSKAGELLHQDAGATAKPQDQLSPEEREAMRELIRDKLKKKAE